MDSEDSRVSATTLVHDRRPGVAVPPVPRAATDLVSKGDAELLASQLASDAAERFVHAHLGALRLAGAVLAASGAAPQRGRAKSAWQQLRTAEPSMSRWAAYFESGARVRAAVAAGRPEVVDDALASRWAAAAEDFRDVVSEHLGVEPSVHAVPSAGWAS